MDFYDKMSQKYIQELGALAPARAYPNGAGTSSSSRKRFLIQSPVLWLRGCHPDRHSDRARLMVGHPPRTIDASEPIRCGKRKGVATDQFDANHPALIAANHRHGVVRFDPVLVRIAEDIAVRLQDCRTTDENRPPRVHAGDVVIRPDVAHLPKICARKRFVVRGVSGENVVLLTHIR